MIIIIDKNKINLFNLNILKLEIYTLKKFKLFNKLDNMIILYNIMTIIIGKNKINLFNLNVLQLKWKLQILI